MAKGPKQICVHYKGRGVWAYYHASSGYFIAETKDILLLQSIIKQYRRKGYYVFFTRVKGTPTLRNEISPIFRAH